MSDIKTYPEMNEEIKKILLINNVAREVYAVWRIEELESENHALKEENERLRLEVKAVYRKGRVSGMKEIQKIIRRTK